MSEAEKMNVAFAKMTTEFERRGQAEKDLQSSLTKSEKRCDTLSDEVIKLRGDLAVAGRENTKMRDVLEKIVVNCKICKSHKSICLSAECTTKRVANVALGHECKGSEYFPETLSGQPEKK